MNARAKSALLKCKTPAEYIDKCIKSSLSRYEKAVVTTEWKKITGYTIDDIKYARHRHPYWKKKKHKGARERNMKRYKEYDFSDPDFFIIWTDELLEQFVLKNKKQSGIYINKDHELAKHFRTTIPSIQYLRRKYNKALKVLNEDNIKPTEKRIIKLMLKDKRVRSQK